MKGPLLLLNSGVLVNEALRVLTQFGTPDISTALACLRELKTRFPSCESNGDELIPLQEAARRLGISPRTLVGKVKIYGLAYGYGGPHRELYVSWMAVKHLTFRTRKATA